MLGSIKSKDCFRYLLAAEIPTQMIKKPQPSWHPANSLMDWWGGGGGGGVELGKGKCFGQ